MKLEHKNKIKNLNKALEKVSNVSISFIVAKICVCASLTDSHNFIFRLPMKKVK